MSHIIYALDKEKYTKLPINLLYITHSKYDKGWHSTLHTHHFTEFFYIIKGKGSFIVNAEEIPVKKNDFIIINPHVEHTEKSSTDDTLEYIALGFEGLSFNLLSDNKNEEGIYILKEEKEEYYRILLTILNEVEKKSKKYEVICQYLLEILVTIIQRNQEYTLKKTDTTIVNKNIFNVKHYIETNHQEKITLDSLAEKFHMDKFYMSHTFKDAFNISPIEYLNQVRIKHVQILLETTNYSISEISNFSGFSSLSYFSQAFKKKLQVSPSEYRKNFTNS